MADKLPPIPYGSPPGSSYWNDWYEKMRSIINGITGSFVQSFNGRTGSVALTSGDVTGALGFTPGTVTSAAATVPSMFSISGSPITTSGTLAITYSGIALPVLNGGTGVTTSTGTGSVVLSASPALTGVPTAPTATAGTSTTQVATTAFAQALATGPAFSAYQSTLQSLSSSTATKIQLQSEEFDTAGAFDNATNYRFQPTTSGYYLVTAALNLAASSSTLLCWIYKNGSAFKRGVQSGSAVDSGRGTTVTALVLLNGTTDYLEFYGFQASGASINTSTGNENTYFQAFLARAA